MTAEGERKGTAEKEDHKEFQCCDVD